MNDGGGGGSRTTTAGPAVAELWPRAVLFDLDGTIADSFSAIQLALSAALAEYGMPARDLGWVRVHVGRGAKVLVRDAVAEPCSGDVVEAVAARYDQNYRTISLDRTPPMPGAREALEFVATRSSERVAIVSNKPASLCRAWLEYWDLARFVAEVSGPDTSGALKPATSAVLPTLQRLGVSAAEAIMVGDMEIDAQAGGAVGMPVLIVARGQGDRASACGLPVAGLLSDLRELSGWLVENGRGWG